MLSPVALDQLRVQLVADGAEAASGRDATRSRGRRRAQGAYFTPPALVEFVVDRTLSGLPADRLDGAIVLDPAAGDGRFLAAAGRWLDARGATGVRLIGVERDPEFARVAAVAVARWCGSQVHCAEALLAPPDLPAACAVVGNPPYIRSIHLERADPALWRRLRGRYEATSHGEWDLYAAFLEQSLAWVRPGGQVGLVVPSRWMTAQFAGRLRARVAGSMRAVVDFGALQVFPGATTYASVAFLTAAPQQRVCVGRWTGARWRCGDVESDELGAQPWRLSTGRARARLARAASSAPALGEVARIAKGTGTNADRVFVLEGGVSRALGEPVDIESALLRPCVRGRDVRPFGAATGEVQLVYPYDDDGALIAPEDLPPRARAYFARCRDVLEARERGRFAGDRFYQFGRPQNHRFLADPAPKVVVPDVAREGRAMMDATGAMVLDSAYAIRLLPGVDSVTLDDVLAALNSPLVAEWLRETAVQLRGGYVRMKTAYLASLPLTADAIASGKS